MKKTLTRSEVPIEETWNLKDLFETEEAWERELGAVQNDVKSVTHYKGRISKDARDMLDCLIANDALNERVMRVMTYAHLQQSEDGTNPINQARAARVSSVMSELKSQTAFIESEILELNNETITSFLNEEPRLEEFLKTLNDLLELKPYRLSSDAEEILAAFGEVHSAPYMIYERSKTSDMKFTSFKTDDGKEHHLTFNSFPTYEGSAHTDLRRKAYDAFVSTLNQYKNTYAATYATEIKKQVVEARLRNYESATQMLLHEQQVTEEMYNNQLNIILTELAPHMRRYAKLKQHVLGLEKMTFADLKAPLDPNFDPSTTYEEASQLMLDSLKVMGNEYMDIIEKGVQDRWVDRADNTGKRSGAFCSSPYGVHPYILMTWNDSMRNAFTLAHELGHAAHFVLSGRYQRISNTRPSRYFIEAPSTMNEMLLSQHILEKSTDVRMRRWVVLQSLGTYYHNFVTHILEGELQRRVYELAHNGTPITANLLCEQKKELLQQFWGDAVEIDEGASLTWMRQPHYYMGLYPYTYSAGLTASTAAAQMIKEEGQPAVDRWLSALKAGGTLKPLDLMKLAGVDMTTSEPIKKAVAYVGTLVDELETSF
ncbi:oligoendopeptidase F [Evansella cellulosilytica]|uniref:Oligopeptidase F n=1 Tax=Evansella cellulosilytica (strain ATCC 21833 / DSM 2522 / FERM P-1141 / JCM 9156 / N-4) TaxID=649639 RepID=E6TXG9_EVAC2|nr:oligoendopeptidase F [Evansella cellulosilytica]ADU28783.1 oligoendopeptidase F [Evansella cellulosilytica DSM 2522]